MNKFMSMVLAVILLAGMLSGCFSSGNSNLASQPTTTVPTTSPTQLQTTTTAPTQPTTVPTQPEDTGIELEARVYYQLVSGSSARKIKWPVIIKSAADLKKFADSDFGKSLAYISEAVDYYDDTFFAENNLILVCLYSGADSFGSFSVESCIKKDGYYLINLGPGEVHVGPNWYIYHILFIEVKDDIAKNAVVYFEISDMAGIDEIVLGSR